MRRVARANPRTVVVVNAGAPVLLPWRDEVGAVLLTWFGGQEFGAALASVLLGDAEPGGRLPTTWPGREEDVPVLSTTPVDGGIEYREGLDIGYRAWARGGAAPAYPFGHGLGYTTWDLTSLHVAAPPAPDTPARVSIALRNTGARAGRTVVQAYLSRAGVRRRAAPAVARRLRGRRGRGRRGDARRARASGARVRPLGGGGRLADRGRRVHTPGRPVGGGAPAARRDRRAVVFAIRTRRATSPTASARATPTTSSPSNAGCRSSARSTASTASSG